MRTRLPPDLRARVEERVAIEFDDDGDSGYFPDLSVIESETKTARLKSSGDLATIEPIPLRATDDDVQLDIQSLVDQAYEDGDYETIDYRQDPHPPLSTEDAAWADELLKAAARRPR